MQRRKLGNSSLTVSPIGVGFWGIVGGDYWGAGADSRYRQEMQNLSGRGGDSPTEAHLGNCAMTSKDSRNLQRFRRSMRLQGYDYRQSGAYFVTICTYQRQNTFGTVIDGNMVLSQWDEIVNDEWRRTETVRANVELDAYVIMPNHFHGVVLIVEDETAAKPANEYPNANLKNAAGSLGQIIGHFKSIATKRIRSGTATRKAPVWQRGYYEHIIRNGESLNEIRAYISSNPRRWSEDSLNISGR